MSTKYNSSPSLPFVDMPVKRQIIKSSFIVHNDKGLHTRPSTELVRCAAQFTSQINLIYKDLVVNGKSILSILTLAASRGARIEIVAVGADAQQAVDTILELAKNIFHTQY